MSAGEPRPGQLWATRSGTRSVMLLVIAPAVREMINGDHMPGCIVAWFNDPFRSQPTLFYDWISEDCFVGRYPLLRRLDDV